MKSKEFSKVMLVWELVIVTAMSVAGFYFAYLSIESKFTGSLPWITAMIAPSWAAYGVSKACYTDKAKAENIIKIPAAIDKAKIAPEAGSNLASSIPGAAATNVIKDLIT